MVQLGCRQGAFSGCTALESVILGDGVTEIGSSAFYSCKSLTSIVIPDSVTTIGGWAFNGCNSLNTVYFGGTEVQWNSITIGSDNTKLTAATRYYYAEEDDETVAPGTYWHFDTDCVTPVLWTKED